MVREDPERSGFKRRYVAPGAALARFHPLRRSPQTDNNQVIWLRAPNPSLAIQLISAASCDSGKEFT